MKEGDVIKGSNIRNIMCNLSTYQHGRKEVPASWPNSDLDTCIHARCDTTLYKVVP
jgi:hypothetical protein